MARVVLMPAGLSSALPQATLRILSASNCRRHPRRRSASGKRSMFVHHFMTGTVTAQVPA